MSETTVIQIPLVPNYTFPDDPGHWSMPRRLELEMYSKHLGRTARWALGYVDKTGKSRREDGGPILPGPDAYVFPLATVISSRPQALAERISVKSGDVLNVGGQLFRIEDNRRLHYPQLVPIDAV